MNVCLTSATVMPFSAAACRSTWSEPTPAVRESSSCFAFCRRSLVRYAGQKGVVMTMSVDGSSLSSSAHQRGPLAESSRGAGSGYVPDTPVCLSDVHTSTCQVECSFCELYVL